MRVSTVTAFSAAVLALVSVSSVVSAQDNQSGCARDVSRLCRAVMDGGDMAVLACLKQNRSRLSKTCSKVLTDNGQ